MTEEITQIERRAWTAHLAEDEAFQKESARSQVENAKSMDKLNHAVFGVDDEVGMKQKVDELHALLTQSKNVIGFFSGFRGPASLLIVVAAAIVLIKGGLAWLLTVLTIK